MPLNGFKSILMSMPHSPNPASPETPTASAPRQLGWKPGCWKPGRGEQGFGEQSSGKQGLWEPGRWRRAAARSFFVVFATVVLIDIAPRNWAWMRPVKQAVCPHLNYCGFWQGQWTLFAPNPILNNAWLSAEIYRPDGSQQEVWNSTYWANSSGWERFVGFRRMNYRNQISAAHPDAANDFADYLARQLISPTAQAVPYSEAPAAQQPTWRLVLTRNQMNFVLPDDGTLPTREQTLWISSSKNLAVREYLP